MFVNINVICIAAKCEPQVYRPMYQQLCTSNLKPSFRLLPNPPYLPSEDTSTQRGEYLRDALIIMEEVEGETKITHEFIIPMCKIN